MNADRRVEALEAENERLRDRIEELERILKVDVPPGVRFPVEWRLTGSEARLLNLLGSRDVATKDAIFTALYGDRLEQDEPEPKIVDVFVCKLRKKIKPFGLEIETVWGAGYRMTAVMRDRLSSILLECAA